MADAATTSRAPEAEHPPADAAAAVGAAGGAPSVGQPDWDAVAKDVHCPLCGYNLSGLTEPRCPECGYASDWDDLLHPERNLHPYLFEHHARRRPMRSFARTLAA